MSNLIPQAGAEGSVMLGVIRSVQRKGIGELQLLQTHQSSMHKHGYDDSSPVWE